MLFKSHSDEQIVWKNKNKGKHDKKVKSMINSMSSDEQYSNRPITLFLPPPVKNYKSQKQSENRRGQAVQRIINYPKISNDLNNKIALTKQSIPFSEEQPSLPIIANNNQEITHSILPTNNVNDIASKLFGQFFSNGDNTKDFSSASKPPRMAAAPLTGSPFDLFNGGSGGLAGGGGIGGQSSTLNNPLLQMLSQGSTLEQITTLTKNLLQMSNGNKEILSTLMNAITGGTGQTSKLTSSALATASLQKQPPQINSAISTFLAGNKSTLPSAVIIEDEELFGINGTSNNKFLGREEIKEVSTNGTFASPNGFSLEQRKLLAAAVLNGELDPEQAVRLLTSENGTIANETISELNKTNIDNSLFDYEEQQHQTFYGLLDKNTKKNQHLINSESKLIEWIQQNRPRHSSENLNENKNATTTFTPLNRDWTNSIEKLPYWGRYCGSFVAHTDNSPYNIAGAVWTVDERRLLITKFTFIPYSHFENITFWAGPSKPTGNAALDLFPSENGFIVEAIPLELNIFNRNPIQIEAKIFNDNIQMDKTEAIFKNENGSKKVGKNE
ncbi:hypothetical protein Mgra_00006321 [Meloidogyne graminicola]|uniref:Uncharacterized protein n=1 Tax=Meloidogyne graminicola TaxID=189291 RepID=A0A8S9ZLH6_9BILA|nr:hypothetical protein Mgra_00006321 [Meloidogyne graminicola]